MSERLPEQCRASLPALTTARGPVVLGVPRTASTSDRPGSWAFTGDEGNPPVRTGLAWPSRRPRTRTSHRSGCARPRAGVSLSKTPLASLGSVLPSAFHRVVQRSPLRHHRLRSPLPPTGWWASALRCQAPRAFRPRGSSPPRRFTPPQVPRACCIPQATMGFTGLRPRRAICRWPAVERSRRCVTLQSTTSREAGPTSPQAVAPSPLPGCRPADLEALLLPRSRRVAAPLPVPATPRGSHGLSPPEAVRLPLPAIGAEAHVAARASPRFQPDPKAPPSA